MAKTDAFLLEAFSGESQANRKYLAFAEKAEKEEYHQVARLFRAAAAAETVHAHNHLKALKGVGNTIENLKEAIAGETHEFKEMYPEMIEAAQSEGNKIAERSFHYANEVEKIHAHLYEVMLENLENIKEEFSYFVCPVCGYTAERGTPDKCPVCGAKGTLFEEIK